MMMVSLPRGRAMISKSATGTATILSSAIYSEKKPNLSLKVIYLIAALSLSLSQASRKEKKTYLYTVGYRVEGAFKTNFLASDGFEQLCGAGWWPLGLIKRARGQGYPARPILHKARNMRTFFFFFFSFTYVDSHICINLHTWYVIYICLHRVTHMCA